MLAIRSSIVIIFVFSAGVFAQTDHPQAMTVGGGVNPVTLTANGTDSYAGTLPKPILSYQPRACYAFSPDVQNTGPACLALDSLPCKSIVRQDGSALSSGDLKADQPYVVCYAPVGDNLVGIGVGAAAGGGGGSAANPGGSSGQLQYNNGGTSFGGITGTSVSGSRLTMGGKLDVGTGAYRGPSGTALPVSCETGDEFFKTDAPAGRNKFGCTAPNTWTLQGDGGGNQQTSGCASGPGIHIPATGRPTCAKGTATAPWAWGGLDFPNPASSGTTSINLDALVPPSWNGQAPDMQVTYSRPDGSFTAGNKFLISVKTWYLPDASTAGSNATFSDPHWNTETLNDVTPTGSDVLGIDQKYTTTIRSLNLGVSPNQAQPKGTMKIQFSRQASGAGGRTDTLAASVRIEDAILRWSVGTKVTSSVGTTSAGTSIQVVNGSGAVANIGQRILILGAGSGGANYTGTITNISLGTFPAATFTLSPATSTSVPEGTLVAFEAVIERVFNFTGTGPESASGSGGAGEGSQLFDDPVRWATVNGTTCNISGVNLPASASTACVVNSGTDPEAGIQFPDTSASTNYVYLRSKTPPNWDNTTPPTLFLTADQIGAGSGNMLFKAAIWHIPEGASYESATYTSVDCTAAAGPGDLKKVSIVCPSLSITGAGAGRAYKLRVSRAGSDASDTLTTPVRIFESAMRWTLTSACPAP